MDIITYSLLKKLITSNNAKTDYYFMKNGFNYPGNDIPKKDRIQSYFNNGSWDASMVQEAVAKNWITQSECDEIITAIVDASRLNRSSAGNQ